MSGDSELAPGDSAKCAASVCYFGLPFNPQVTSLEYSNTPEHSNKEMNLG